MTYFMKETNRYFPTSEESIIIKKVLPTGTYSASFSPVRGYYLEIVDDFKFSGKVYGDIQKRIDRVIHTFMDRPVNTGVLLSGEKGSGKTLFAKLLSLNLIQKDIITILVNQPLCGEQFNLFIQSINQPAVVFFDEFEKVYPFDAQNALLTLFDGVSNTRKLFVITCNDSYRVVDYFKNRPGRFYYLFNYKGLDRDFIREYVDDNLINKNNMQSLMTLCSSFTTMNFDMLKALVEEMNRYNENASEVVQYINATPLQDQSKFKVEQVIGADELRITEFEEIANGDMPFNPFRDKFFIEFQVKNESDNISVKKKNNLFKETESEYSIQYFKPEDIIKVSEGQFVLKNKENYSVTIVREYKKEYNVHHILATSM